MDDILLRLEKEYKRCSDWLITNEYKNILDVLCSYPLDYDIVKSLCDKSLDKKHWPGVRFESLRVLLLNSDTAKFDLKQFFFDNQKRSRRLYMRLFFMRGYALYATEEEMIPLMKKLQELLLKNHDYIDYEAILSIGGLPYLVEKYGYKCCVDALETAKREYLEIDPLLRGQFTFDENLNQVDLLTPEESNLRYKKFLEK